jgi:hypothetical protein
MRPEALRPAIAKAAATLTSKLGSRLSKGENATANAWPKSARCMTSRRRFASPPRSWPTRPRSPAEVATPHLGYVALDEWEVIFAAVFEQINALAAGRPVYLVGPAALTRGRSTGT